MSKKYKQGGSMMGKQWWVESLTVALYNASICWVVVSGLSHDKQIMYNLAIRRTAVQITTWTPCLLLPFAKKLVWAFVHHPVFQSSHHENWGQGFLMYTDDVNRVIQRCMHNSSTIWSCQCGRKDPVLAPPNRHQRHWYGYQSSPIIDTEVQGPVLVHSDIVLK